MADETMFARLKAAMHAEMIAQWKEDVQKKLDHDLGRGNPDIVSFGTGGCLDVAAIVRALLAELRTAAGELPDGFDMVAGPLLATQRDQLREAFRKVYTGAIGSTPRLTGIGDGAITKAGAIGFIDAILAEAAP